jgi:type VI secretion system secreted protein VgrG
MVKIEGKAMLQTKAPMAQHNADALMIIKGGLTMIN